LGFVNLEFTVTEKYELKVNLIKKLLQLAEGKRLVEAHRDDCHEMAHRERSELEATVETIDKRGQIWTRILRNQRHNKRHQGWFLDCPA
jgi:hypothetical protein